ncbi:response regulator transcription factor, partial [Stenotrophomonas maltophilia]|uniref:response regulator n=1 Tax=Stenotrophomonas maltophilia TaxID=40324 RepID=UPI0031451876
LGDAAEGEEALARYQQLQPDRELMDRQMPRLEGVEAIVRIRAMDPRALIIVLTTYLGEVRAVRAFQAGASDYQ